MRGKIAGIRYGIVVSNTDEKGGDRIAVRLMPEDNSKKFEEIVEAASFPLLPKMFYVKPKVGEGVFVLLATANDGDSQRYYIGPVVSQIHRMYYEPYEEGGDTYQRGGRKDFDVDPYSYEDAEGMFPGNEDVAIIGRKNTDIILKDDDIRIRAGVKLSGDDTRYKMVFNRKSPAYIKLKYHEMPLDGDNHSTATIVADKINLFSNKSNAVGNVHLNDKYDLITDDDINTAIEQAYKLPYGEKLVQLLKTMIRIFVEHTHDYIGLPPNALFITEITDAANEPLEQEKLLSDSIRIN